MATQPNQPLGPYDPQPQPVGPDPSPPQPGHAPTEVPVREPPGIPAIDPGRPPEPGIDPGPGPQIPPSPTDPQPRA
jgi:hypothetical protein